MIVLLQIILLTFIWVMGVKISTAEGMIFEKLGDYAKDKIESGHKIWEALINCEWCLPSVHSIFGHAFAFGLGIIPFEVNKELFIRWPLVIMGTSLISGLTWTIYKTINKIRERNEAETNYLKSLIEPEKDNQTAAHLKFQ